MHNTAPRETHSELMNVGRQLTFTSQGGQYTVGFLNESTIIGTQQEPPSRKKTSQEGGGTAQQKKREKIGKREPAFNPSSWT